MRFLWHSAREVRGDVWNHEQSIRQAVCEEHARVRSGRLCPLHTPPCSWLHTGQHKVSGTGAPSCLQLCLAWLQVSCSDISVSEEPLPFQTRAMEQQHQSDVLTGVDRARKAVTHATGGCVVGSFPLAPTADLGLPRFCFLRLSIYGCDAQMQCLGVQIDSAIFI